MSALAERLRVTPSLEMGRSAPASPSRAPPSQSPHFNMARARKFIGGLLKRRRPDRSDFSPPEQEPAGDSRKPDSYGNLSFSGRFGRKGSNCSSASLDSKEYSPPGGSKVGSPPLTPPGGSSGRNKYRPWRRHSSPWRPLTQAERRGVKAMLQLAAEADKRQGQRSHLEKTVLCMLDQLALDVDVTAVVDNTQRLQLMQWSVINGWHQVLEHLLERGHPADMDHDCNGPLHLASKLGDVRAAELLMRYGASINTKSTACYPSSSLHLMHNSPFGPSAYCYVHFNSTPLQIALAHDNVHVVKLLMEHTAWETPVKQALVLHQACRCHADSCVEYLINMAPSSINVRDPQTGETPLSIALDVGESVVRTLLQSGATIEPEVLRNCNDKGDCVLHRLFVTESCPNILALTLMLQECGVDLVSCQDRTWNTPLHLLCSRMTRLGRRSEYNLDHLPDIYLCAQYLMSRMKDPNVKNRRGESVLHMLFSGCWISFQHQFRYLEPFLRETKKILKLLLSYGVNPDISSSDTSTVINTVVNCCCGLGPEKAERIGQHLVEVIQTLCIYNADLDSPDEKGIYMLTRLLTACSRWLLSCTGNPEDPPAQSVFRFIGCILQTLFKSGMCPPEDILRISVKQLAIITITSFDESGFCREMKEILGLIFCAGLNPNSLKVMSDGLLVDDIKTDDLRYCIARGFVTHREHKGMMTFFSIFQDTLNQDNLNSFSHMICLILETIFQESFFKRVGECAEVLRRTTQKPRSLSYLCRVSINNALEWRVLKNSQHLPLPAPLQTYLLDFN